MSYLTLQFHLMDDHIRRYNVERSCLRCHERKVRCDKGSPCNKCVRLGVTCQYPGPRRAKRRPPKTTVTDVVTRLEQLERSIATLANSPVSNQATQIHNAGSSNTTSSHNNLPPSHTTSTGQPTNHGFLVRGGGCYIDEPLLSRVLEKEKELQSALGSPSNEGNAPRKPPPLKVDGIITNPQLVNMELKSLQPDQWQATVLWHIFVTRVDPVLKVVHIPTTVTRVFGAISRPDSQGSDVHCLLFAIFFAATTARCSDEPANQQLRADLRRYQLGLELAMHHSSFLDSPTVTSLQALAIYLVSSSKSHKSTPQPNIHKTCLRYTNSGRSGFTLRGLAIRAAQSIGLHRDGKHFKLNPLECELRRRLWWNLYSTDARMAEDHGLTVAEQEFGGDTDLPSNIDDQDVHEDLREPPLNQHRWTEMSFSLIIAEINKMWVPIARSTNDSPDGSQPENMLQQLKNALHERYLQYSDLDIPIQRQGVRVAQVLITKAEVHIRQKLLQSQGAATTTSSTTDTATTATQDLLGMAVNALELGLEMHTDQMLRGFRWLASTYTQFHLLTYILWHLCVYPTGPHVDRAWRGVDRHFDLAENDPSWPDPGPKWPMIAQMRAKALRNRQAQFGIQRGGQVVPVSAGAGAGTRTVEAGGVSGIVDEGVVQGNNGEALLDMGNWDLNWLEFPDWSFLAQSIAIMGQ